MVLSTEAKLLLYEAWGYASQHSTDGAIPPSSLPLLTMGFTTPAADLLDELRAVELVIPGQRAQAGQDVLADYLGINPTAQQVKKKSAQARKAALAKWSKVRTDEAPGNADSSADSSAMGNAPNPPNPPDVQEQDPGDVDSGLCFTPERSIAFGDASAELGDDPVTPQAEKDRIRRALIGLPKRLSADRIGHNGEVIYG
jgi:hypothetical protein